MTIKINVSTEEEQGECDRLIGLEEEPRGPQRTSSGLVSTQRSSKLKRVSRGDEAAVATAIPGEGARGNESLLTIAKREAARRMLYSKFYRGEVLRGEYDEAVVEEPEGGFSGERKRERKKKRKRERGGGEEHDEKRKKRKPKGEEKELESGGVRRKRVV